MKVIVVSTAAVAALALAAPAQAKPNAQDASFIASAGARALTEVNVGKALLHARGANKSVRSLASLVVRRAGHETRAIARLAKSKGLPSAGHGKRRGTEQVQHLAKRNSAAARDRSYVKLTISDLDSHIRTYKREVAKGRDAAIKKQATQWLSRLTALRAQASVVLAKL
jgi:hypothetical protein